MKKVGGALLALAVLLGISVCLPSRSDQSSRYCYIPMADEVVNPFIKDMHAKYGLIIWGSGGGAMDDVDNITLDFLSSARLDVAQARELYLAVSEDLLARLTAKTTLRPYLHEYPATHRLLTLAIRFKDGQWNAFDDEFIDSIMMVGDRVDYLRYNQTTNEYDAAHMETYTEALEIVRAQSANSD